MSGQPALTRVRGGKYLILPPDYKARALSASLDNTLRLWNLASGETLLVLEGHSDSVIHIVALPGDRALSASSDSTLRLWDLASGETLHVLEGHSDSINHVAALPGERALSASDDNTLRLWRQL